MEKPTDPKRSKSFWTTMPGVVSAVAALLTAIVGLLTAIHVFGGGGSLAVTTQSAASQSTPPSTQEAGRIVWSGSLSLDGTDSVDLDSDSGQSSTRTSGEDIWLNVSGSVRVLQPINGAGVSNLGVVDFDSVDLGLLKQAAYSSGGLDASGGKLAPGTVLAIRTSGGRYVKLRVESLDVDLEATVVVYA